MLKIRLIYDNGSTKDILVDDRDFRDDEWGEDLDNCLQNLDEDYLGYEVIDMEA